MDNNFTIYKSENDKRLVFGWASIAITVDGEQLEDRQGDMIDPEDLEDAAYEYVLNFRDTGEEHLPGYRKKGKLVESVVLTEDKQKAMGIPEGTVPVGWWLGFYIEDDAAWEKVKNGTYRMFSIEGKAEREPIEKAAKAGCGVLVVNDGKILTGRRIEPRAAGLGAIGGPGGHIEEGETPEQAAIRETREEFGIKVKNLKHAGSVPGSEIFICTEYDGEPSTDEEEMTDLKWRNLEELKNEKLFKPFEDSLKYVPQTIRKFNPFHDSLGKFSSAGGMKTYSANPKTKAGQMAIARSSKNHGRVLNVHRESKGENIAQNQRWITTGQKPAIPAAQAPKTTAKPKTQAKPKQPQNAPKTQPQDQNANQTQVKGNDVRKYLKSGHQYTVNEIAEMQGYKGKGKVVSQKEFDEAAKKNGNIAFRTIDPGTDVITGKKMTAQKFADNLMNGDAQDFALNGNGLRVLGSGLYIAQTNSNPGHTPTRTATSDARQDSQWYGGRNSKVVQMTVSKDANIGDFKTVQREYNTLPPREQIKYSDVGAYAAAKGYDGLSRVRRGQPYGYTTIYNRTVLTFLDQTSKNTNY